MPTIYHKATGEALECHSVDAREILECSPDIYSHTPPAAAPVDAYPNLSPAQEEALDHVMDGQVKPGGSPKGGNRRKRAAEG